MRIRWTEPAAQEPTNICDYTEEHDGPEVARRAALRIYEALGSASPNLGLSRATASSRRRGSHASDAMLGASRAST